MEIRSHWEMAIFCNWNSNAIGTSRNAVKSKSYRASYRLFVSVKRSLKSAWISSLELRLSIRVDGMINFDSSHGFMYAKVEKYYCEDSEKKWIVKLRIKIGSNPRQQLNVLRISMATERICGNPLNSVMTVQEILAG